jgi:hypothetical protein
MRLRRFRWNPATVMNAEAFHAEHDHDVAGLIAEEVYELAPHLIHLNAEGQPQAIDLWGTIGYLVEAVQYLRGKVEPQWKSPSKNS